jgi:hypothetical protein
MSPLLCHVGFSYALFTHNKFKYCGLFDVPLIFSRIGFIKILKLACAPYIYFTYKTRPTAMNDSNVPSWYDAIPTGLAWLDRDGVVLFANQVAQASLQVNEGVRIKEGALLRLLHTANAESSILPITGSIKGRTGVSSDIKLMRDESRGTYLLVVAEVAHDIAYQQALQNVLACLESVAGHLLSDFLANLTETLVTMDSVGCIAGEDSLELLSSGRRLARELWRVDGAARTLSGGHQTRGERVATEDLLAAVFEESREIWWGGEMINFFFIREDNLPAIAGSRIVLVHSLADLLKTFVVELEIPAPMVNVTAERAGNCLRISFTVAGTHGDGALSLEQRAAFTCGPRVTQTRLAEAMAREMITFHGGSVLRHQGNNGTHFLTVDLPTATPEFDYQALSVRADLAIADL